MKKAGFFKTLAITGVFAFTFASTFASDSSAYQNISEGEITDNAETDNSETNNPETNNPETDNPETDNSETDNSETDTPKTDNDETDDDETDDDETDDDWIRPHGSELASTERLITYHPMGGAIYYINKKDKEIMLSNGPVKDFYDTWVIKTIPYKLCVGGSYDEYKYVVKKGNQNPAKGQVSRFVGWYTDEDYKNKFVGDVISKPHKGNITLYAKYMYDSDLSVPVSEYNKKHNSGAFNLKATCSSKITYKSNNTKLCRVDKKGNVRLTGLVGEAKITVATEGNQDYSAKSIDVIIKVKTGGPAKISKIHNNSQQEITVSWTKTKNVDGYKLYISTNINFPKTETNDFVVKGGDKTSIRLTKFSPKKKFVSGKKYFFKLCSYKAVRENGNGTVIDYVYSDSTPKVTYAIKKAN